jgi:hypothetical protein
VIHEFGDVFASYFKKKNIGLMLTFVILYRMAEGLLEKIGPIFLIDEPRPRMGWAWTISRWATSTAPSARWLSCSAP